MVLQVPPYGIFLSVSVVLETLLHPQQVSQGHQRFAP